MTRRDSGVLDLDQLRRIFAKKSRSVPAERPRQRVQEPVDLLM